MTVVKYEVEFDSKKKTVPLGLYYKKDVQDLNIEFELDLIRIVVSNLTVMIRD